MNDYVSMYCLMECVLTYIAVSTYSLHDMYIHVLGPYMHNEIKQRRGCGVYMAYDCVYGVCRFSVVCMLCPNMTISRPIRWYLAGASV